MNRFSRFLVSLAALSVLGACDIPIFHGIEPREVPTDLQGCAPDAGADGLSSTADLGAVILSWSSEARNEAGFLVERRSDDTPAWNEIGRTETDVHTLRDETVSPDIIYTYRVKSYRLSGGEECPAAPSGEHEQLSRPQPVAMLQADSASTTQVILTWNDPNTHSIGFRVSRRIADQSFSEIGTVDAAASAFFDSALTPGQAYDYAVVAENTAGLSAPAQVMVAPWQNPALAWADDPILDPACYLTVPGQASYALGTEATFAAATGSISQSRGPVHADSKGVYGPLTDLSPGEFGVTWSVLDTFGGSTTLPRTLALTRTPGAINMPRRPLGTLDDPGMVGRQARSPQCTDPDCQQRLGSIALGMAHGCTVTDEGGVLCWGYNDSGELGAGGGDYALNPVRACAGGLGEPCALPLGDVVQVESNGQGTSGSHACALTGAGEVLCWGDGVYGQLGNGAFSQRAYPGPVCTGPAEDGPCAQLTGISQIAVGSYHACALAESGEVYCWGENGYGQAGAYHGRETALWAQRVCWVGDDENGNCVPLSDVRHVSVGAEMSCALVGAAGDVYCWGRNFSTSGSTLAHSFLGHRSPEQVPNPVAVTGRGDSTFATTLVAPGELVVGDHACLWDEGGALCWGLNDVGQIGDGTVGSRLAPVEVCAAGAGPGCPPLTDIWDFGARDDHGCAVVGPNGEVRCWGENDYGQLGFGYLSFPALVPQSVCMTGSEVDGTCEPLLGASSVAVGKRHTCALMLSGESYCWGNDSYGQLGDGSSDYNLKSVSPTPVCANGAVWDGTICDQGGSHTPMTGVVQLVAGNDFTCGLLGNSEVRCWGYNASYGRLGDGTVTNRHSPVPVCESGTGDGQRCVGTVFVGADALFAGFDHICALVGDELRCWGRNSDGQLGVGTTTSHYRNPVPVCASGQYNTGTGECSGPRLQGVGAVGLGWNHSCAILAAGGELFCWGVQSKGQVGSGLVTGTDVRNPIPVCESGSGVTCVPMTGVEAVGAGVEGTCARRSSDEVFCWGAAEDPFGFGPGLFSAQPLAVCVNGWGATCEPLTGQATVVTANNPSNKGSTCVRSPTGAVQCWGDNSDGQLGNGTATRQSQPGAVCRTGTWDGSDCAGGAALIDADQIFAGHKRFCALAGGETLCWGSNHQNVIAAGSTGSDYRNPIPVCAVGENDGVGCPEGVLTDVEEIALGQNHSCVRRSDGAALCWGDNDWGQLGSGNDESVELPAEVCLTGTEDTCVPLDGLEQIAAGSYSTCVLRDGGNLWCSGDNRQNELGAFVGREVPHPVEVCASGGGLSCVPDRGYVAVAAVGYSTCGLTEEGGVRCWGANHERQLGDGTGYDRKNPVDVCQSGEWDGERCLDGGGDSTFTGAVAIALGGNPEGSAWDVSDPVCVHACVVTDEGGVMCWGNNEFGQLGIGETGDGSAGTCTENHSYPQQVGCPGSPAPQPGCPSPGALSGAVAVDAGYGFSCALLSSGDVSCWGRNDLGQLGTGGSVTVPEVWAASVDLGGAPAISLALGTYHACVVLEDQRVACWGDNGFGAVGDGTMTPGLFQARPTLVCASGTGSTCVPLENAVAVAAGLDLSCALLSDSSVRCWGSGDYGELGNGRREATLFDFDCRGGSSIDECYATGTPQVVCAPEAARNCDPDYECTAPLSGMAAIAGGYHFACGLTAWGGVRCWGNPYLGRRGDGIASSQADYNCTPTQVCQPGAGPCDGTTRLETAAVMACDLIDVSAAD